MGTISTLQGNKTTNIINLCLSLMLISSADFSVAKIKPRIPETPKQSTEPVVHPLQSPEQLQLTSKGMRVSRSDRRGFLLSSSAAVNAVLCRALKATSESCLGSKAVLCHGLAQWELWLFFLFLLPAPLPQSSGCSPSLPHPSPAGGKGGVWGSCGWGALPGDWCDFTHDVWGEFPITCS